MKRQENQKKTKEKIKLFTTTIIAEQSRHPYPPPQP
jgi:hypothetical protein